MMAGESADFGGSRKRTAKARTVKKKEPDTVRLQSDEEIKEALIKAAIERRSKPGALADRLAGDTLHYRNYYYPGGMKAFPHEPKMQSVDKLYPLAKGSPLLVDEPVFPEEIANCERKKPVMRAMGHRYICILPEMSFEEAMEELER